MQWVLNIGAPAVAYGVINYYSDRLITRSSGAIAGAEPHQAAINRANLTIKNYAIMPLQSFEIEAHININQAVINTNINVEKIWKK